MEKLYFEIGTRESKLYRGIFWKYLWRMLLHPILVQPSPSSSYVKRKYWNVVKIFPNDLFLCLSTHFLFTQVILSISIPFSAAEEIVRTFKIMPRHQVKLK